ncbi:MAG: hypothetical protein HDS26_00220 [Bacteroides sp.]|nr:hypothetical protein [Bacteroides sp.]
MKSRRNVFIYFVAFTLLGCYMSGCRNESEKNRTGEARALFEASAAMIRSYTDSLRVAKDSASVQELTDHFENAIAKLNFSYPPDTDVALSEYENDTLAMLIDRYLEARQSRLKELHLATVAVKTESEPNDSIAKE